MKKAELAAKVAALEAEIAEIKRGPHVHHKVYRKTVWPREARFDGDRPPMMRYGWLCIGSDTDEACGMTVDYGYPAQLDMDPETAKLLG